MPARLHQKNTSRPQGLTESDGPNSTALLEQNCLIAGSYPAIPSVNRLRPSALLHTLRLVYQLPKYCARLLTARSEFFADFDLGVMAERQGFEPWRRFPAYTLSRRAPSTTRPPLREAVFTQKRAGGARGKCHILEKNFAHAPNAGFNAEFQRDARSTPWRERAVN